MTPKIITARARNRIQLTGIELCTPDLRLTWQATQGEDYRKPLDQPLPYLLEEKRSYYRLCTESTSPPRRSQTASDESAEPTWVRPELPP